jgi:hypothetical protein
MSIAAGGGAAAYSSASTYDHRGVGRGMVDWLLAPTSAVSDDIGMPLDVNDLLVRELYGRIVLGGARLEANVASLLAWLQTPRMTSPEPARKANNRMTFARMIEQCRLCLSIREDDGVLDQEVAGRLRGFLDRADPSPGRAQQARPREHGHYRRGGA